MRGSCTIGNDEMGLKTAELVLSLTDRQLRRDHIEPSVLQGVKTASNNVAVRTDVNY